MPQMDKTNSSAFSAEVHHLFALLEVGNQAEFIQIPNLRQYIDAEVKGQTLLDYAASKGLLSAVKILLSNGAKVTIRTIELSADTGHYEIFSLLLENEPQVEIRADFLVYLFRNIATTYGCVTRNQYKCIEVLLEKRRGIDVNTRIDSNANTLLHYAVKNRSEKNVLDLLRYGASLACRNKDGVLPIQHIDANTLETHLNECLDVNLAHDVEADDFMATFNYKTFMLPHKDIDRMYSDVLVVLEMGKIDKLVRLLKHPVIMSILYIKWLKIRYMFYMNSLVFLLYFVLLIAVIMARTISDSNIVNNTSLVCIPFVVYVWVGLSIAALYKLHMFGFKYFLGFGNWVHFITIYLGPVAIAAPQHLPQSITKQAQACFILLSSFEIVHFIGMHPKMSTYAAMVYKVAINFFKFLMGYSIFILAFSLSFFILFQDTNDFANPGLALFRTIIMLTGEFETSSLNFQAFPVTSRIIFVLFVFTITIILMNLLTGLAVSDMQSLKSKAETFGHLQRARLIASIDNMLSHYAVELKKVNYSIANMAKRQIAHRFLSCNYATVYPNRAPKGNDVALDDQTVESMKELIRQKRRLFQDQEHQQGIQERDKQLQEKLDFIVGLYEPLALRIANQQEYLEVMAKKLDLIVS